MGGILFTLRVCFMGKLKRIIGNDFVCVSNDVGAGAWSKCKQSQLIYYNWENELNLIKKWLSSTRNIYCICTKYFEINNLEYSDHIYTLMVHIIFISLNTWERTRLALSWIKVSHKRKYTWNLYQLSSSSSHNNKDTKSEKYI